LAAQRFDFSFGGFQTIPPASEQSDSATLLGESAGDSAADAS